MNARRFSMILSIVLLFLTSSGCKEKNVYDSGDQTENEGGAAKGPSAETQEAPTDVTAHKTPSMPAGREQEQITLLPARAFRSDIPFRVVAHTTQEELLEWDGFMRGTTIGEAVPGQIIEIPRCRFWFVTPTDGRPDWEKIATEVAQRNIPGLQVLNITDADLSHLASLKDLTYLAIVESDGVTDAGLKHIEGLKNLQMLVLSNCDNLTDSGLKHLRNLESLQMLFLNCTRFTGGGLVHLKNLKELRILWADCSNTEPGLECLQDLQKLRALILIEARTTDAGLEYVKGLKNLERLALESANVTDAGLKHLESLKNLKMLYFDGGQCTDTAVESLKKALPDCELLLQ